LGIADGLADPRVHVLDPCCGTGAYLVAVIRRIHATLAQQSDDALMTSYLRRTVMERIYGFELLPAPFVIAHLQVGMLMAQLGLSFSGATGDRAGIYLTNALTGWDPAATPPALSFPEFQQERDAAQRIKQEAPILVILGNPPYNGYAGVALVEERGLTSAYCRADATIQPQGQGLNDLYIRFYRVAERRIVEGSGRGIVCFISNYSWLDGLSFTAMRERYLRAFDRIWIDFLNGDKYKTGKLTPDGAPDPSIFSTERNREGIQVGTAIALLLRREPNAPTQEVAFRHLWGTGKRAALLADAAQGGTPAGYLHLTPPTAYGFPFIPLRADDAYAGWPALPELLPTYFPGVKTSRDDVVVDIDRDRLVARMQRYFDPAVSHEELRRTVPGALQSTARFPAEATRDRLRARGFLPKRIVRYCYRPFDLRWLYIERPYAPEERAALDEGMRALGFSSDAVEACLGASTCDVYLNSLAYWRNVPARVWTYTLGGYQVLKKWLSYREQSLLGRDLRVDDVREFTAIARRITAILLLEPQLDANYATVASLT
jgi:predicted helicase